MVQKLAQFTDIRAALVVGGLSLQAQAATLREQPEIVVATPVGPPQGPGFGEGREAGGVGCASRAMFVLARRGEPSRQQLAAPCGCGAGRDTPRSPTPLPACCVRCCRSLDGPAVHRQLPGWDVRRCLPRAHLNALPGPPPRPLQGRMIDHLRNTQSVGLEDLAVLVLDEADRLLEMGFAEEVRLAGWP